MIVTDQKILTAKCESILPEEYEDIFLALEQELANSPIEGVGLAAPQIGIHKRAFIINAWGLQRRVANPKIIQRCKSKCWIQEGCLSLPDRMFWVRRHFSVTLQDDLLGIQEYQGYLAAIVQHETDHCDSLTLIQTGTELEEDEK